MSSQYPVLKAQEVVRVLRHHGFILIKPKGGHQKWRNPATGKQVIVAFHKGKDLPLGTLKSIIEGSGILLEEWRE